MQIEFLQDLAVILIVAGVVTVLFRLLRQPVVLGYIVAGIIVGPHTPPARLVHDEHIIHMLAELGVIFLLFSLGLHFSLRRLAKVGATALIAAVLEILLMVLVGYEVGKLFGWSEMDSIFLGAMLSISSTTIIVRALAELHLEEERFAHLIFGILVVEDILAIAMIALLSTQAVTGRLDAGQLVHTLGRLAVFLVVLLVVGLLAVPRLLRTIARFRSDEALLITALGLCLGVSLLAVRLGYSAALGAFLAGAIIAEARECGRISELVEPVRDMFSAVFFVAIGMLIDPVVLWQYALPIAVITLAVVVGKVVTCSFGAFIAGNDTRTSLRVGMGLAQIGEFSFIIAQLGLSLKVTSEFLYPIVVGVAAVTTLLTPYLIRASDPLVGAFERRAPRGLMAYLRLYGSWASRLGQRGLGGPAIRGLVRKTTIQLVLNLSLITAFFIAAAWLAPRLAQRPGWAQELRWVGGPNTVPWLAAMFLSLPLITATFRKSRAMAMLIAELAVPPSSGPHVVLVRSIVSNTILVAAMIGLAQWLLVLSAAVLPPLPILIVLLLLMAGATVLLWRRFITLYASAQVALRDTLAPTSAPTQHAPSAMLREADLGSVVIPPESPAAGKLLRQLDLRAATGASAVGIDRDGQSIVNPGPDEELQAGDRILLLGRREHLDAAKRLLVGE